MRLRCENALVNVMLDRFGQDVILIPDGPDHFLLTVEAVVSPSFTAGSSAWAPGWSSPPPAGRWRSGAKCSAPLWKAHRCLPSLRRGRDPAGIAGRPTLQTATGPFA